MARKFASVQAAVWEPGSDFRELTPLGQWAYVMLLSQPQITNVGLLTYTPGKWARLASGLTVDQVEQVVDELATAWFVLVDRDTGELLIRTFIRHDGLWKQPKLVVAARRQFREIESEEIRDYLAGRHPWLADETWKQAQIRDHEEAQEQGVSQGVNQPLTVGVGQATDDLQGLPVTGPRLQAQQQEDQELRTKNLDQQEPAAAALEAPRQADIDQAVKGLSDHDRSTRGVVEPLARTVPAVVFTDVVERTEQRIANGNVSNHTGLFVDLLRKASKDYSASLQLASEQLRATPLEDVLSDARFYAVRIPWDAAEHLIVHKLKRLGVQNGSAPAILDAARAAYATAAARSETP